MATKTVKTGAKKPVKKSTDFRQLIDLFDNKGYGYCVLHCSEKCQRDRGLQDKSKFWTVSDKKKDNVYTDGIIPICKDCAKEFCYNKKTGLIDIEKFKIFLRMADIPFKQEILDKALVKQNETIGTYIQHIKFSMADKGWKDGEIVDKVVTNEDGEELNEKEKMDRHADLVEKWGRGYNPDELELMEKYYKSWIKEVDPDNERGELSEQFMVKNLVIAQIKKRRADESSSNVDTDKLEKSIISYMDKLKLTPDTRKEKDDLSKQVYGEWVEHIEWYKPAEWFKNKSIYEDFDGIMDYMKRHIFRPLKNLLTGSRDFDGVYNINEDSGDLSKNQEEFMYDDHELKDPNMEDIETMDLQDIGILEEDEIQETQADREIAEYREQMLKEKGDRDE